MSKPYPKISPNAMRQDAHSKDTNWHSHPPDTGRLRSIANKNNEDHSNISNGQLNGMDRDHGAIKGGC